MNSAKRREEKKRRREKRSAKKERGFASPMRIFGDLVRLTKLPAPVSFPGACDPSLAQPDMLKLEYAQFVSEGPLADRSRRYERDVEKGLLGDFPEIDHWAIEEFLWHGAPGQTSHPIDEFLRANRSRFSPEAQQQIALWKQARIGFFEIGNVADDLLSLRELDPLTLRPIGDWTRAIALCIGGVNQYASQKGKITTTYVAPWSPSENIHCMMGYGSSFSAAQSAYPLPIVLGFRQAEHISRPMPWNIGKPALLRHTEQWLKRDWFDWMQKNVPCPFQAIVPLKTGPRVLTIDMMVTKSADEVHQFGLYYAGKVDKEEVGVLGATNIFPIDLDTPRALAFAEYRKFREVTNSPAHRGQWK